MRQKAIGSRRRQKSAAVAISLNAAFFGSVSGEHAPSPAGRRSPFPWRGEQAPSMGQPRGVWLIRHSFLSPAVSTSNPSRKSSTEAQSLNRIQAHAWDARHHPLPLALPVTFFFPHCL